MSPPLHQTVPVCHGVEGSGDSGVVVIFKGKLMSKPHTDVDGSGDNGVAVISPQSQRIATAMVTLRTILVRRLMGVAT